MPSRRSKLAALLQVAAAAGLGASAALRVSGLYLRLRLHLWRWRRRSIRGFRREASKALPPGLLEELEAEYRARVEAIRLPTLREIVSILTGARRGRPGRRG